MPEVAEVVEAVEVIEVIPVTPLDHLDDLATLDHLLLDHPHLDLRLHLGVQADRDLVDAE